MIDNKALELLAKSENFLPQYVEVIAFLERAGIVKILRDVGNTNLSISALQIETVALKGAYVAGWQECLDCLLNFVDKFVAPHASNTEAPRADFGSLNAALDRGDLDEEEQYAIRTGTKPDYSKYITTTKTPRS